MKIADIFSKNVARDIKGVIVADEHENDVIWQELEEYVITHELKQHFGALTSAYLSGIDDPREAGVGGKIGIWISGFFGSGKSHFLKILSYLFSNLKVTHPGTGQSRTALDFFAGKFDDSLLFADLKRALSIQAEVVLFNIDAKADISEGRDVLLSVFLRVFNELQGFNGDYPRLADLERHLIEKQAYDQFQEAFADAAGSAWVDSRDAWTFHEDAIVSALIPSLSMNQESARNLFKNLSEPYTLNIEGFANKVNDYLKTKPRNYRLIFLVDEVGQFIGQNSQLMLNMQTIVEEFGSRCKGRAWIIVTSQEDIDKVLGETRSFKDHDFSKIQGRFRTRLSLSSSNTDEVIQLRLLEKTPEAAAAIGDLYDREAEVIKNQIRFDSSGPTFRGIESREQFISMYPFVPYQFKLVQDVFESIRRAGATGLHLSRGERSMLNAFQDATLINRGRDLGALVPFKDFYPSIESFLDTAVRRTIEQAKERPGLEPFDVDLLRILFLIRYTEKNITGTLDNLVTLCVDGINADRHSLKQQIEAGLKRLLKENLIDQNGEIYYFLTNEEQDINRDIANVEISGAEEIQTLSEWIFQDILGEKTKHKYSFNREDYAFNRFCDGMIKGRPQENVMVVEFISPLFDQYNTFNESRCLMRSNEGLGRLVIKLPDRDELVKELRKFKRTQKYIARESDSSKPATFQRIISDRAQQNTQARKRTIELLKEMILSAEYYALGTNLTGFAAATVPTTLEKCLEYLIANIYTKLDYIRPYGGNVLEEIRAVILADDLAQRDLLEKPEYNPRAIEEIRIHLSYRLANGRVGLSEIVEHFSAPRFGWPPFEIALIVARLWKAEVINVIADGKPLEARECVEHLSKNGLWKKVALSLRRTPPDTVIRKAKEIGKKLFDQIGPDSEGKLYEFLREQLDKRREKLRGFRGTAETGDYPGLTAIDTGIALVEKQLQFRDHLDFFNNFVDKEAEWIAAEEQFVNLKGFYEDQLHIWKRLLDIRNRFKPNQILLPTDHPARVAFREILSILASEAPYGRIREANALIRTVEEANRSLMDTHLSESLRQIAATAAEVRQEFVNNLAEFTAEIAPLVEQLKQDIENEFIIPVMETMRDRRLNELEQAAQATLARIAAASSPASPDAPPAPAIRKTATLKAASLTEGRLIETEQDVESYLDKLRARLRAFIAENTRIRIQ